MKKHIGTYAILGLVTAGAALAGGQVAQMAENSSWEKHNRSGQPEAIQQAIESGDYTTWNSLVPEDAKIREVITQENFDKLQQLHELRGSGDQEEAQILREDLGLPAQKMMRGKRGPKLSEEDRAAHEAALESGDYAAFVELLPEDHKEKFVEHITAENFDKFATMHELRKSGDKEGADALRSELGLPERGERKDMHQEKKGEQDGSRAHRGQRQER